MLHVLWIVAAGCVLLLLGGCATIQARRAEAAYPPIGEHLRVGELDLHMVRRGEGQPVIFIHGSYGTVHDLTQSPLWDQLPAAGFEAIAFDRPGFGYSDRLGRTPMTPADHAQVLQQFIETLDLPQKPIVVGHSWGGSIALAHAVKHADVAAGYVLISPASHTWGPDPRLFDRLSTVPVVGDLLVEVLLVPLGRFVARRSLDRAFGESPVPEQYAAMVQALALRPRQYRSEALDIRTLSAALAKQSEAYPDITAPMAIVASENDRSTPPDHHARKLVRDVPQARLWMVPGSAHTLHFTDANTVMQAIEHVRDQARTVTPTGD